MREMDLPSIDERRIAGACGRKHVTAEREDLARRREEDLSGGRAGTRRGERRERRSRARGDGERTAGRAAVAVGDARVTAIAERRRVARSRVVADDVRVDATV